MANYPYHNYQQPTGYQQSIFQQFPQQNGLFCRPVTCLEEVRAVPVDFGGAPMVFLDAAHGMVYTKVFNSMTGEADVVQYQRVNSQPPQTVSFEDFHQLQQTVSQLQQELEGVKYQRKRVREGDYESDNRYFESYSQRGKSHADNYDSSTEQSQLETSEQYLARQRRSAVRDDRTEYV